MQLDHVTLFVSDAERSLGFYSEGLGLAVLVDEEFDGDWPGLFGVESTRVRAIVLGDPGGPPGGGLLELVTYSVPVPPGPPPAAPHTGTAMLALRVDLEAVAPRLLRLGASDVRNITMPDGLSIMSVRDPDGVLIELIDTTVRG